MFIWSFGLDLVGLKKGIFLYYKNSFLWTKFYYNTLTFKIITRKAKLLLKKKHYQENLLQKTDGQLENIDKLVWQFSNYCLCQYSMLCCILLYYLFVLYICIDLYVYTFIELRGLEKKTLLWKLCHFNIYFNWRLVVISEVEICTRIYTQT